MSPHVCVCKCILEYEKIRMLGLGCCISWDVSDNNHYAKALKLVFVQALCFNFTFATFQFKLLNKLLNMSEFVFIHL